MEAARTDTLLAKGRARLLAPIELEGFRHCCNATDIDTGTGAQEATPLSDVIDMLQTQISDAQQFCAF